MNPELQNTLAQLAQKMGTSVERLWPMLVAKQKLDSFLIMATFGTLGAVCILILLIPVYFFIKDFKEFGIDSPSVLPIIILGLLALIFSAVSISAIPDYVYPEAATVQTLLKGK